MMIGRPVNLTGDGAGLEQPGVLIYAHLYGGSATSSAILYNNPSAASGDIIAKLQCAAGGRDDWHGPASVKGVFVDLTGTAAEVSLVVA